MSEYNLVVINWAVSS